MAERGSTQRKHPRYASDPATRRLSDTKADWLTSVFFLDTVLTSSYNSGTSLKDDDDEGIRRGDYW